MLENIKQNSLLRGIGMMLSSSFITNIIQFLQFYILVKFYTQEEFGLWASVTSIAAILVTGDFGITNVLRNILSKQILLGKDGDNEARKYFYSAFFFFLLLGLVLSGILVILSPFIPYENMFETENEFLKIQGRSIFIAIQVIFLVGIPFGIGLPLFYSYGEIKYVAIFNLLRSFITFAFICVFSVLHSPIVFLSIGYFSTNLLFLLISTFFFIYKRQWFYICFKELNIFQRIKEMLLVGIKFLGIQLSSSFMQNALIVYSASMVSLSMAANISVVNKIFLFCGGIYQTAFNPIWSSLTIKYENKDYQGCLRLINKSTLFTIITFTIIIIGTLIFGQMVIDILIGKEYICETKIVLAVGGLFMLRVVFDNLTLLLNAISKLNLILCIELCLLCLVLAFASRIIENFGFYYMSAYLAILWIISIIIVFFYNNKLLKYE